MNKKIYIPGILLILTILLMAYLIGEKRNKQTQSFKTETLLKSPSKPSPTGKFNYGDMNYAEDRFVFPSPIPENVEGRYFRTLEEQKEIFETGTMGVGTKWQEALRICDGMGLKEGDCIADIGTAYGHDAIMFSQIVGSTGKVYAVDTRPDALYYLLHMKREMARKYGQSRGLYFENLVIMLDYTEDLVLPPESLDFALMKGVHTLYYLPPTLNHCDEKTVDQQKLGKEIYEYQKNFMKTVHKALKPDGKLVLIDGGEDFMAIRKETLIRILSDMGFTLEKDLSGQGYATGTDWFHIFTKKKN